MFAPAEGGASIGITVGGAEPQAAAPDLPNVYCRPVQVGALTGTSCLDTIARSTEIVLSGNGKTYHITVVGKHIDASVYDRFLSSFRLL